MLAFLQLTVDHFKAFRRKQTFAFPTKAGLYQFSGKNRIYPGLGSNACGKSSLFDALSWVIYGKTARGLRAGDVSTWKVKGTPTVELIFRQGKSEHTLIRTWKPNSLTLDGETATQEQVEGLIGFNHESFLATVLMSQFGSKFFDLSATEKLKVFSNILDLQLWLDLSKRAASIAKECEVEVNRLQLDIAGRKSEFRLIKQQIADETEAAEKWDNKQRKEIKNARWVLLRAGLEQGRAGRLVTKAKKELADAPDIDDGKLDKLGGIVRNRQRSLDKLKSELSALIKQRNDLVEDEAKLKRGLIGKRCPVCGSTVEPKHLRAELARVVEKADEVHNKIVQLSDDEILQETRTGEAERLAERGRKAFAIGRKLRDDLRQTLSKYQNNAKNAVNDVVYARKQLETVRGAVNVHENRVSSLKAKLVKVKAQWQTARDKLGQLDARQSAFTFWAKEFKNLRLWLITESLQQLEVEVNNSLIALGLRGWEVSFDVEKVTKAGTVSRGFSVFIRSPSSPRRTRWESWSGGESTRLLIASALGLSQLIRNRYGIDCPLEVFDEPSTFLSKEGRDDLTAFLKDRADAERKQIWLISHESQSSGHFDGKCTSVLTSKGAVLVQSD